MKDALKQEIYKMLENHVEELNKIFENGFQKIDKSFDELENKLDKSIARLSKIVKKLEDDKWMKIKILLK